MQIRRLKGVFKMSFVFVFRRCLQDILINIKIFVLVTRQDGWQKRLQDISKTFWRCLEGNLKTSSNVLPKHLEDIFKTSWKRIAKMSSRHLQDVFKTYHQVKLFLSTRLQDVFEMYSIRFWDVLEEYYLQKDTLDA